MTTLHIDAAERKKLATKWIGLTMWALHIWASILVIALILGHPGPEVAEVIAKMFATVTFGIGATLAILLIDRAADIILSRVSLPTAPMAVTETVTRTVEQTPAAPSETTAATVNMKVEGDVNVDKTK